MPPRRMSKFTYVYILQSENDPVRFYVGCTRDLRTRLARHNAGNVRHTAKWLPWRLKTYIAFADGSSARKFEQETEIGLGQSVYKKTSLNSRALGDENSFDWWGGIRQTNFYRMLRPACSTILTNSHKARGGFSFFHATHPSVPTLGVRVRKTTLSCSSFFNCSGTMATPNPEATA